MSERSPSDGRIRVLMYQGTDGEVVPAEYMI